MYRFLTLFSKEIPEKDSLFQCMTQDFFYSGFEVIDSDTISKIVSPYLKQSRLSLESERENYIKALGKQKFEYYLEQYEKKPDFEKPLFSLQIAYYIARNEIYKSEIVRKELEQVKFDKVLKESERNEYELLKIQSTARLKKHQRKLADLRSRKISKRKKKKENKINR